MGKKSQSQLKRVGGLFATGLVATSLFANMPTATAVDTGSFGKTVSASEASKSFESVPVDNSALLKAVEEAKAAGLIVSEDAVKAITVGSTDEVAKALKDIEADYQAQIEALTKATADYNKAKAEADATNKANDDAYAQAKLKFDQDKSKHDAEVKKYEADKAQYDKDLADYEKRKADASKANSDSKAAADKHNADEKARYDAEMAAYNSAMDTFRAEMAAYEAALAKAGGQTNAGNPLEAQQPDQLFLDQPFSLNANNRTALQNVDAQNANDLGSTNNWYDAGSNYNSDTVKTYEVNRDSVIKATYNNVATDKETGRELGVRLTVSNFHFTQNRATPIYHLPAEAGSAVELFSNFMDSVAIAGITYGELNFDYFYMDNGEAYNKDYYITTGSLHGVKDVNGQDATGHYEFSGPVSGVKATFTNKNSIIERNAQDINSHEGVLGKGFMIKQGTDYYMSHGRTAPIGDESNEALTVLGVTYLVSNGATISFGVSSAVPGQDYDNFVDWYNGGPIGYNHLMLASDTVAPIAPPVEIPPKPVEPTKPAEPKYITAEENPFNETPPTPPTKPGPAPEAPKPPVPVVPGVPEVKYQLSQLKTPVNVVDKVAKGEGKKVVAGETTTQTVSYKTSWKKHESFAIGDHIYLTEDGRMPVSVDLNKVKVTQGTADGEDVTDKFDITFVDGVHLGKAGKQVIATAKDAGSLPLNTNFVLHVNQTSLFDGQADTLLDAGFAIDNGNLQYTSDKVYHEVKVNPSKVETSPVDGSNLDGKTLMVGDVVNYTIVEDTTDLVNTVSPISQSGMKDDFDESAGKIDLSQVKVYQVPADADTSTPEATAKAIQGTAVKDVTEHYDLALGAVEGFTNGGSEGYTGFMKTEGEGEAKKVVLPMGYKYIHVLPFTVTKNVDGDIKNTAWQVTNGAEAQTQTVANPMKKIQPSKDVSIEVGGESVEGGTVALGQVFNYKLKSSDLPADRIKNIDSWTLVDDYDETKDEYKGNYLAQSRFDIVDESGKVVIKAGDDITEYITQDWDEAGGKTTFSANQELLDLLNIEANKQVEQGFEVFMQAKRIGTGDIVNTVTEFVNGQEILVDSDTITPDDQDGPTTVVTHTYESDLRVNKKWIDTDASDGKVSAEIEGTNLGKGTALDAKLVDDKFRGLANPKVLEVKNGTKGDYTAVDNTSLVFDEVAQGEVVSLVLEFDVLPGTDIIDNTASFENEFDKAGDPDNIQENDDLAGDTDQRDRVSLELPKPPAPAPAAPAPQKQTPVVKGESAKTGGGVENTAGIGVAGLLSLLGTAGIALKLKGRKGKKN